MTTNQQVTDQHQPGRGLLSALLEEPLSLGGERSMDRLLELLKQQQNVQIPERWGDTVHQILQREGCYEALGRIERPDADTLVWRGGPELVWALGATVVWQSGARYDDNGIYIGRTPELHINDTALPFEVAAKFGELLDRCSAWIP